MRLGLLAAIALAVALVAGIPTGAQAQTPTTALVSNLGQADGVTQGYGRDQTQAFTTGDNAAGYILDSVDIEIAALSDSAIFSSKTTAAIHSDSSGAPGAQVDALINPAYQATSTDRNFNFPGGFRLAANTTYWLVLDSDGTAQGTNSLRLTASLSEDAGGASGFSIADNSRWRLASSTGGWGSNSSSLKIRINGREAHPRLVSNLGQIHGNTSPLDHDYAHSFTTGSNTDGYTLNSVDVTFASLSDSALFSSKLTASIRSDSSGAPGAQVAPLTNPAYRATTSNRDYHFAGPDGGVHLDPGTTYWLLMDITGTVNGTNNSIRNTTSNSEDAGGASGFSIADKRERRVATSTTNTWIEVGQKIKFGVNGSENPPPPGLVSNLGQADGTFLGLVPNDRAQAFTTGDNSTGYTLDSVDIEFTALSDAAIFSSKMTTAIHSDSSGAPGAAVATLTNPAYQATSTDLTLNFPGSLQLAANTTYWLVMDSDGSLQGNNRVRNTASDSEDAGGASGFSIADTSASRSATNTGNTWTTVNESAKMRVNGSANAPPPPPPPPQGPPRAVFSATWMKVDEPSACSSDTTEQFGAIHDRDRAMYTVRLSSDPGGDATVMVLDPSDSRSGFNRYAGNWGRVTNQPVGDTSAVTGRSNSGTLLDFDSSNWEDPQTIRLNIHCADHDPHTWNDIWHKVTYPGDFVRVVGAASTKIVDNSRWQVTRIRVVDASVPAQPADLSVASAYAGTLTASLNGSWSKRCESTDPLGCEWGFGVEWDWTTSAHPNDIWDAERRFWGFRFKAESGEDSDTYASYVPQPTSEDMIRPDKVVKWTQQRNDSSYQWGVYPSGLYTTVGSTTNPGNPVYRITVTPVTIRGQEVPGEADTLCVQLQSRLATVPQNKQAVVVDCDTMFTAPIGLFSPPIMHLRALVLPALTITSDAVAVNEGERVTFTITAGNPVEVDTIVHVSLAEDLGDSPDRIGRHQLSTVTIRAGERSATWTATTLADEVERGDGSAVATILHGDGYTLGEPFSVSVALTDADASATPELSITAGSGVTEGGDATFTITANPAPAADLDVSVTVSQSGDYGATTGQQTVTIPTTGSATLTVSTTNDDADETNGSVTATLDTPAADAGYTVSATQGAATVNVADDDDATPTTGYTVDPQLVANVKLYMAETYHGAEHVNRWQRVLVAFGELDAAGVSGSAMSAAEAQGYADRGWPRWVPVVAELTALEASQQDTLTTPEVSITAGGGITEGGDASFTVTASPAPAADLDVSVTVSQSGDYGATTGQQTVTIPTTGSVTLTVGTTNDGANEADGSVTATLDTPAADAGYTVSASQGAATVSVADDDVPEISISAGNGVTEGGDATFTVTASPVPAANLDVSVTVSQSGDYGAATGQQTVTIPTTGSFTLTVGTTNDGADEADGSVTATLDTPAADAGYTVSATQGAATVSVADDDVPEISISAGNGVTEGGDATFTITASTAPAALDVSVTVSQSGDYGAATGQQTVTIPTTGSVTLTVSTTNDGADEADGSVTATVNTGSGYTVSASQGAATVSVADDDVPEISISAGNSVTEGGDATFTITASPVPAANLDVSVTVSQSGDYGAATGQRTVTIPPAGSATLTVGTTNDDADEADGSVTATVNTGSGYTVSATQGAATVSVADDDDATVVSVIEPKDEFTVTVEDASGMEGDVVVFRILLSHALTEEFEVNWYAGPAYHVLDNRAHSGDYQTMSDVMVFAPGVTELTGVVWLNDDSEDEPDEYFAVEAFLPGEWFTPAAVGTMTIVDDD